MKCLALMKYLPIFALSIFYSATASAGTINIKAYIDGTSELIIENDTLYWHHTAFAAPGRWDNRDEPTIINGVSWLPLWPAQGRNDFCNCNSSSISGLIPALSSLDKITLHLLDARESVNLLESPSAQNNYRMEIEFDDFDYGGADWYEIELAYTELNEPGGLMLALLGFTALLLRKKFNRKLQA